MNLYAMFNKKFLYESYRLIVNLKHKIKIYLLTHLLNTLFKSDEAYRAKSPVLN